MPRRKGEEGMYLRFMTPDVWDGLVLGTTLIGSALAVVQLLRDRQHARRQRARAEQAAPNVAPHNFKE